MTGRWEQIAADFHERVRANCWDTLAGQLLRLHEPHLVEGQPVCRGCDRERADRGGSDPVWPCRTYTIIASAMLNVQDIEAMLDRLHKPAASTGSVSPARPTPRPASPSPAASRGQKPVAPQCEAGRNRVLDPTARPPRVNNERETQT